MARIVKFVGVPGKFKKDWSYKIWKFRRKDKEKDGQHPSITKNIGNRRLKELEKGERSTGVPELNAPDYVVYICVFKSRNGLIDILWKRYLVHDRNGLETIIMNDRNGLDIIILGKRGVSRFIQVCAIPISGIYRNAPPWDYRTTTTKNSSTWYKYYSTPDYRTNTSSTRYYYCSPSEYHTTTSRTWYSTTTVVQDYRSTARVVHGTATEVLRLLIPYYSSL
jgi:hypothetical protein